MARPKSSLPIAFAALLFAGSVAAQPAPPAPPPGYYPAPPPSYGPSYGPPYAAPTAYPTSRLYSPALLVTGIVANVVGTFAAGFGTAAYMNNDRRLPCFDEFGSCDGPGHGVDTFVMVAGGIAMLAGIPMITLGARRVRVLPQDASLAPRIGLSPRGGTLTFQF
jgi:hypothetical protein